MIHIFSFCDHTSYILEADQGYHTTWGTSVDDPSVNELSVGDISVDDLSADDLPVDELYVDDLFVDDLSVVDLSVQRVIRLSESGGCDIHFAVVVA